MQEDWTKAEVSQDVLERFPKSGNRFSDKKRGENKDLERLAEPSEAKTALEIDEQEIDIFTTASISNGKKGWVIQIATAPTVREADIALYKALSVAGDRLGDAEPYLKLHDRGEERYYRARFSGFKSQKSALNACADLQSRAIDCYVLED